MEKMTKRPKAKVVSLAMLAALAACGDNNDLELPGEVKPVTDGTPASDLRNALGDRILNQVYEGINLTVMGNEVTASDKIEEYRGKSLESALNVMENLTTHGETVIDFTAIGTPNTNEHFRINACAYLEGIITTQDGSVSNRFDNIGNDKDVFAAVNDCNAYDNKGRKTDSVTAVTDATGRTTFEVTLNKGTGSESNLTVDYKPEEDCNVSETIFGVTEKTQVELKDCKKLVNDFNEATDNNYPTQ